MVATARDGRMGQGPSFERDGAISGAAPACSAQESLPSVPVAVVSTVLRSFPVRSQEDDQEDDDDKYRADSDVHG